MTIVDEKKTYLSWRKNTENKSIQMDDHFEKPVRAYNSHRRPSPHLFLIYVIHFGISFMCMVFLHKTRGGRQFRSCAERSLYGFIRKSYTEVHFPPK